MRVVSRLLFGASCLSFVLCGFGVLVVLHCVLFDIIFVLRICCNVGVLRVVRLLLCHVWWLSFGVRCMPFFVDICCGLVCVLWFVVNVW